MKTEEQINKIATWRDVQQKAKRLREQGKVKVLHHSPQITTAIVQGDNNVYDVVLYRQDPNSKAITMYECSCPWGEWAFKRQETFVGRMCSHALATYNEMKSRDYWTNKELYEMGLDVVAHVLGDSSTKISSFPKTSKRYRFKIASAYVSANDLIDEPGEATNLYKLDLEGTHYVDELSL